ncbi:unnamed protein product [Adineta ricciae]|uniref:Coiled-coil domain-containing protein 6 n=1 Tax=Adineta ricciae TaxID=249248 RepID=A0A814JSI5_ADIRI|nr:unnamed protein product [Adineta ricciae]CAF1526565.1 unnamed protein product [Adineta ricciae]
MSGENQVHSMQTDSECESDVSSIADSSTLNREHLIKRIDSLQQENRVLKVELETFKLRLKASQQEIKQLKHASVHMQAKAEQEEEFISNTLLKKIQELKKEKETLANNYEREEEFLTNDLSRKLQQLREEKQSLEHSLEQEQASQINKLMKRIKRLEAETINKQNILEQLKREKIELENTLEKEQESLVNRLWKRMEKLETDKRLLQQKLEQPDQSHSECHPSSSIDSSSNVNNSSTIISTDEITSNRANPQLATRLSLPNVDHIQQLKREVEKLKRELNSTQESHREKMEQLVREEQDIRNENLRLQRKLQLEVDRREQLCRQLSESESSLEMDEERALNERMKAFPKQQRTSSSQQHLSRSRTVSSPSSNQNVASEHSSSTTNDFQRPRPPSTSADINNLME